MKFTQTFRFLPLLALAAAQREDFSTRCTDRTALERVYYNHRLGEKPPFEQVLPPATLETLVRQDFRKEAALKKTYGLDVTPAMLDAEVERINTTTRAPEMLAEIKAALGDDPARFASVFAKPILVERLLREKFDNDDALHAPQRREIERVRSELLAVKQSAVSHGAPLHPALSPSGGKGNSAGGALVKDLLSVLKQNHSNEVSETSWQLGARPAETNAPDADLLAVQKRFGPNAQILSSPRGDGQERKLYFEDLPGELQKVLRVQLRQAGDVSAVIETPGGFLLYLAAEKTAEALRAASLSIPKRSYEQWLADDAPETNSSIITK